MNRRTFFNALAAVPVLGLLRPGTAAAELPKAKITRVRIYRPPNLNPLFNQSNMVVTVETNIGITGIGEGGAKDTLEQCAGTLIGQNPFRTEALWQEAYIAWFYPPGREKAHALGAMDLALWDIKGKALGVPVHELLGGAARDYCECYATGGVTPPGGASGERLSLKERARATVEAGYRAFRLTPADVPIGGVYDTRSSVRRAEQECKDVREGVGPDGNWCIDFHQRFDLNDALRLCKAIEPYEPFFVEDPVRDEHALQDIPSCADDERAADARRRMGAQVTSISSWRTTTSTSSGPLPNAGGITEMMKVAAICETHAVGIVPHFTGPIVTAALVNCLSTFSGPVLFEHNHGGRPIDYLPECLTSRMERRIQIQRPGLVSRPT